MLKNQSTPLSSINTISKHTTIILSLLFFSSTLRAQSNGPKSDTCLASEILTTSIKIELDIDENGDTTKYSKILESMKIELFDSTGAPLRTLFYDNYDGWNKRDSFIYNDEKLNSGIETKRLNLDKAIFEYQMITYNGSGLITSRSVFNVMPDKFLTFKWRDTSKSYQEKMALSLLQSTLTSYDIYEYTSNNKPAKHINTIYGNAGESLIFTKLYSYTYSGLLDSVTVYHGPNLYKVTKYTYQSDVRIRTDIYSSDFILKQYRLYEVDDRGNVTKESICNTKDEKIGGYEYAYDSSDNVVQEIKTVNGKETYREEVFYNSCSEMIKKEVYENGILESMVIRYIVHYTDEK